MMAHSFEEPHANDLVPAFDTINMVFNFTARGPMITISSEETRATIHFAADAVPHVAAGLLSAWSAIKNHCDCEDCQGDDEED